jgi:iron complex transport system substrate-binding protein
MVLKRMKGMAVIALGLMIIGTGFLAGCLDEKEEGSRNFVDQTGQKLQIDSGIERIVTLTPALTGLIVDLGAEDLLVGADSVSVAENPDLSLETVSTWEGLDSEKLVETDPDLVIMDKTLDITEASYNVIIGLSIPVYRAFPRDFDSVMEMIDSVGEILEMDEPAAMISDDMRSRKTAISEEVASVAEANRPVVLYVTYYDGTSDPWVGTDSTFSGDLIEIAGGRNSLMDATGVVIQVSVETIIVSDPDIIITSQSTTWPTPSRNTILNDPTWEDISAVKEGKVFDIDGDLIDRTGADLIDGLETIHETLYP